LGKCKNILKKDRKLQKIHKEDLKITAMIERCSRIKKPRSFFLEVAYYEVLTFYAPRVD